MGRKHRFTVGELHGLEPRARDEPGFVRAPPVEIARLGHGGRVSKAS